MQNKIKILSQNRCGAFGFESRINHPQRFDRESERFQRMTGLNAQSVYLWRCGLSFPNENLLVDCV